MSVLVVCPCFLIDLSEGLSTDDGEPICACGHVSDEHDILGECQAMEEVE